MLVQIFTKDHCPGCHATVRRARDCGLVFEELSATQNAQALKEAGFSAAPVVMVLDEAGGVLDAWSGYRPEKISRWHTEQLLDGGGRE